MPKNHFKNPLGSPQPYKNALAWLKFYFERCFDKKPAIPDDHALKLDDVLAQLKHPNNPSITWLGHACFLIRMGGKTLLTDPYLTDYASPSHGIGPKRFIPAAIPIPHLPKIDIIVISHNHYDHLDTRTIEKLPNAHDIQVIVPIHLGSYFRWSGFKKVVELNWYDQWTDGKITIKSLPVIHYSKRGLFDRNESLWSGFKLCEGKHKLFFGGDTAYGDFFKNLGKAEGPFDYAILGIGAYEPRRLMGPVHATPEEAVAIGQLLNADTIIAMHWGTIILSEEPIFEPPERFKRAGLDAGIPDDKLWVLKIGETRNL